MAVRHAQDIRPGDRRPVIQCPAGERPDMALENAERHIGIGFCKQSHGIEHIVLVDVKARLPWPENGKTEDNILRAVVGEEMGDPISRGKPVAAEAGNSLTGEVKKSAAGKVLSCYPAVIHTVIGEEGFSAVLKSGEVLIPWRRVDASR